MSTTPRGVRAQTTRTLPEIHARRRPELANLVLERTSPINVPQSSIVEGWTKSHPIFEATKYMIYPFRMRSLHKADVCSRVERSGTNLGMLFQICGIWARERRCSADWTLHLVRRLKTSRTACAVSRATVLSSRSCGRNERQSWYAIAGQLRCRLSGAAACRPSALRGQVG
jgi:hypothetical protein